MMLCAYGGWKDYIRFSKLSPHLLIGAKWCDKVTARAVLRLAALHTTHGQAVEQAISVCEANGV